MFPFIITDDNNIMPLNPLFGVAYNTIGLVLLPIIYISARICVYICNLILTSINSKSALTIILATYIVKTYIEIEKIEKIFYEIWRRLTE